jgi:hypothetical protein
LGEDVVDYDEERREQDEEGYLFLRNQAERIVEGEGRDDVTRGYGDTVWGTRRHASESGKGGRGHGRTNRKTQCV